MGVSCGSGRSHQAEGGSTSRSLVPHPVLFMFKSEISDRAVVTNYHRLGGFKQRRRARSQSWGLEVPNRGGGSAELLPPLTPASSACGSSACASASLASPLCLCRSHGRSSPGLGHADDWDDHFERLNVIAPAKTLSPNQVLFAGSGGHRGWAKVCTDSQTSSRSGTGAAFRIEPGLRKAGRAGSRVSGTDAGVCTESHTNQPAVQASGAAGPAWQQEAAGRCEGLWGDAGTPAANLTPDCELAKRGHEPNPAGCSFLK